jgi:hypothetical protein
MLQSPELQRMMICLRRIPSEEGRHVFATFFAGVSKRPAARRPWREGTSDAFAAWRRKSSGNRNAISGLYYFHFCQYTVKATTSEIGGAPARARFLAMRALFFAAAPWRLGVHPSVRITGLSGMQNDGRPPPAIAKSPVRLLAPRFPATHRRGFQPVACVLPGR